MSNEKKEKTEAEKLEEKSRKRKPTSGLQDAPEGKDPDEAAEEKIKENESNSLKNSPNDNSEFTSGEQIKLDPTGKAPPSGSPYDKKPNLGQNSPNSGNPLDLPDDGSVTEEIADTALSLSEARRYAIELGVDPGEAARVWRKKKGV